MAGASLPLPCRRPSHVSCRRRAGSCARRPREEHGPGAVHCDVDPVEEVGRALGTAPWYQLYMPNAWDSTERLVKRVEAAGCPVLVWTIDLLGGRNLETAERARRIDKGPAASSSSTLAVGERSQS